MTDPLSDLFAGVPLPWENPAAVIGMELPDNIAAKHLGPPIACPVAWLQRSRIPLRELVLSPEINGIYQRHDDISKCYVALQKSNCDVTNPRVKHTLWHEIGHAIDFISERDGKLEATNHGYYSCRHRCLLEHHAKLIVSLRLKGTMYATMSEDAWMAYASEPIELWAELVALACTNPGALESTALWPAIHPDLRARNISVPDILDDLAKMMRA